MESNRIFEKVKFVKKQEDDSRSASLLSVLGAGSTATELTSTSPPSNLDNIQVLSPKQESPSDTPITEQPGIVGVPTQSSDNSRRYLSSQLYQFYLGDATVFNIEQDFQFCNAIACSCERGSKYRVTDVTGRDLFTVDESPNHCCQRQFLGSNRPLTLWVRDKDQVDVLKLERPQDGSDCCGALLPNVMSVSTPDGQLLGKIEESCHIFLPKYKLKDVAGKTVLKIKGPWWSLSFAGCLSRVDFKILSLENREVGSIQKQPSTCLMELCTDVDSFTLVLPPHLDPTMKALCLGALFLIEFNYFEWNSFNCQGCRKC